MMLARRVHLYLGCIFAPLLIFYVVTGSMQTFRLQKAKKDGSYKPFAIVEHVAEVHEDQHIKRVGERKPKGSTPYKYFVLAMALSFVATSVLGVVLAFQVTKKPIIVILCLVTGTVAPIILLFLGGGFG